MVWYAVITFPHRYYKYICCRTHSYLKSTAVIKFWFGVNLQQCEQTAKIYSMHKLRYGWTKFRVTDLRQSNAN